MIEIPGYYLKSTIGSGGMATVYLAVQESLDREVALKVMSPVLSADATFAARFRREARTIARLSHPNIVQIFDVGTTEDNHNYFSMQYLSGGTLKDRLGKRLDETELLRVFTGVLRALGFAHDLGFVHRDVKPENVLFDTSNTPILTDFGIARALRSSTRITETGMSVGTGRYMSPEQAKGNRVDARSDLYSLGVVLYEALAGSAPFESEDTFAVAYAHVNEPLPPLPSHCSDWDPIMQKALAKDPAARYPSAKALEAALEAMARRHRQEGVIQPGTGKMSLTRIFGNRQSRRPRWRFWKSSRKPAQTEHSWIPVTIPSAFSRRMLARARPWIPQFLRRPVWRTVQVVDQALTRLSRRLRKFKRNNAPGFYLTGAALVALLAAGLWLLAERPPGAAETNNPTAGTPELAALADDPPRAGNPPVSQVEEPADAVRQQQRPDAQNETASQSLPESAGPDPNPTPPQVDVSQAVPRQQTQAPAPDTVPELLAAGDRALADYRLTTPAGDNALEYFLAVLAQSPDNAQAQAGIRRVVESYLMLVEDALENDEAVPAAEYLLRAREVATTYQLDGSLAVAMGEAQQPTFDRLMELGREAVGAENNHAARNYFALASSLMPGEKAPGRALAALDRNAYVPRLFSDPLAAGGEGPNMVLIPVGEFQIGNAEFGQAQVTIERPFAMSRREISVDQFRRFVELSNYKTSDQGCEIFEGSWWDSDDYGWRSPGFAQLGNHPVVCVSWDDAQAYANWLSVQTGQSYRLPSEVEWEYALVTGGGLQNNICRQGNVGDQWLKNHYPRDEAFDCADGTAFTAPGGSWPANDYGLYDLVGNAREWVLDCWHGSHAGRPAGQSAWLSGSCDERVIKGSSWVTGRPAISPAHRLGAPPDGAYNAVGFRVVREVE